MKLLALIALIAATQSTSWLDPYRPIADRLIAQSQSSDFAWRRLAELTDTFGPRLSGTPNLEQAIDWAAAEMARDGLENVHKEPVMVPKWVRGRESLDLVKPVAQPLVMLGLGGSVGTPPAGIEAEVLVVQSFDDLTKRAAEAKGRIVLFNVPFTDYGTTVAYRRSGAARAARVGAVASVIRSVGPMGFRTPHTGATAYDAGVDKIPAAAIPAEDADRFQRLQDRRVPIRVRLKMEAHTEPDAPSFNVVGELRGRELPNQVVVVGGHIDSWDVGAGAVDDGGGCIVTWEALRLMKTMGLRPRRTVRVVLFTNEENGTRGGDGYRDAHRAELANHVAMLESDIGVFNPTGIGFSFNAGTPPRPGADAAGRAMEAIATLLKPLGADHVLGPGGGTDIEPAAQAGNIPMIALNEGTVLDSAEYFRVHHTDADNVARITPRQVSDNAAVVAILAYVLADMPGRLGQ